MVPSDIDPAVVKFPGYGSLSSGNSVLISPLPIDAPDDSSSDGHVTKDVASHETTLSPEVSFRLLGSFAEFFTNPSDGSVQLETRQ